MYYIVSFSGGKDSTAMLLMMLDREMEIDEILYYDIGMEFPSMYAHIRKVEKDIGRKITTIKAKETYEYLLGKIETRGGYRGYGHPSIFSRWCTAQLKIAPAASYLKGKEKLIQYIGINVDEKKRAVRMKNKWPVFFPLIDWNIGSKEALEFCYSRGYTWDGLYDDFSRSSCWCCPFKRIGELKTIYTKYPILWEKLKKLDGISRYPFKNDLRVIDFEMRFKKEIEEEKQQLKLF